jgi:hypothetical protein
MQFQVNEQNYFLNYVDEEGRWFVFKPTLSGIEAVPVVDDDPPEVFLDEITVEPDHELVN